ncbi:MAG: isoquinoline 1-oxidoreductase [unclassified Hahellaceae]|nr:isoquinoline 1-oxidoreductase [Hahellaceae bacterium]|tara:strand:- start:3971 stop:6292 length:2322 start_codon:yes stop_codon:yes gene_type:complete
MIRQSDVSKALADSKFGSVETSPSPGSGVDRRSFLKLTAGMSGALCVGISLQGCATSALESTEADSFRPNASIEVLPDSQVLVTLARVEMGQGTMTGISTLVAEELNIDPGQIKIVFAPPAEPYVHPEYGFQITGGSNSLSSSWLPMRQAAATTRMALVEAAADLWSVAPASVRCDKGLCYHPKKDTTLTIGQLAGLAANRPLPEAVELKPASEFRLIGKPVQRPDAVAKTFGEAQYGIDVELEDMVYAYILRAPMIRGRLTEFDASKATKMPGVLKVAAVPSGVAVIADSWWQAKQAAETIKADWVPDPEVGEPDTADIFRLYEERIAQSGFDRVREQGDLDEFAEEGTVALEAEYRAPFLAHATLEPQNCVAWLRDGKCDIWAPTQGPDIARFVAQRETGLHRDDIQVHQTYIGGGFGRRLSQDYVADAASVAVHIDRPVKVIWTREDDTRHDIYRPGSLHRLKAFATSDGSIEGWQHKIAAPKVITYFIEDAAGVQLPGWAGGGLTSMVASLGRLITPDISAFEGADDIHYGFNHIQVDHHVADAGIPVTYWRAVGHSFNGFVVESFIDELADAKAQDPLAYRLQLLAESPRHQAVLKKVASIAGWHWDAEQKRSLAPAHRNKSGNVVQGLAVHKSFGTYVAQIVELELDNVDAPKDYRISRVFCAVDCGTAVNPEIVRAQMESGIIFGITAAKYGDIEFEKGRVKQSNFHDYQLLRMNESPEIEVAIIDSDASPTGVGEPGLPPVAAAIGNALFAATGQRLRQLPLRLS